MGWGTEGKGWWGTWQGEVEIPSMLFQARGLGSQLGAVQVNSPTMSWVWGRLSFNHPKRRGLVLLIATRGRLGSQRWRYPRNPAGGHAGKESGAVGPGRWAAGVLVTSATGSGSSQMCLGSDSSLSCTYCVWTFLSTHIDKKLFTNVNRLNCT